MRKKVNRVERHLYVDRRGELRAHSARCFAGRAESLRFLAFYHEHIRASRFRQVIGYARTDNSPADNNYIRRLQTPSLGLASAHTFY